MTSAETTGLGMPEFVGPVPAVRHLSLKAQTATILLSFLLIEMFVVLLVYANSQLLPGNWSGLLTPMMIYVVLGIIALLLVLYRQPGDPMEVLRADRFLLTFVAAAFVTGIFMIWALGRFGQAAALTGVDQLQDLVYVALFVAPVEETLFRIALPLRWGWAIPAVGLFSLMHLGAYTGAGILLTTSSLTFSIIEVAAIGGLLWVVNRYIGFGAAVGVHSAYDLAILGAIGGFAVAAAHLQLVPV